jgi:hypothetical protein
MSLTICWFFALYQHRHEWKGATCKRFLKFDQMERDMTERQRVDLCAKSHSASLTALLALIALFGAGQTSAAPLPADLATRISANVNTVNASGALTYTVTVSNLAQYKRVCTIDPNTHRRECEIDVNSLDATGVAVDITLPSGMAIAGQVSADSGLNCSVGGTVVHCSNGTILAEDAARITVPARAPNTGGTVTVTALADPNNAITERKKTNNSARVTVTVRPPQNTNLPDLFAVANSPQSTFDGKAPVDFNVRIYNGGPVDASNVSLEYFAVYPSVLSTPSFPLGSNVNCSFITDPASGTFIGVRCTGVNVPAYNAVLMQVRMIPSNTAAHPLPPGTNYGMYGTLDPGNAIAELNERNNLFNAGVLVAP